MNLRTWRLGCCITALAALQACVQAPQRAADDPPPVQGRLALRVDPTATQAAQSVSASFELTRHEDRGELRLLSPLGTIMALARWSPQDVSLDTGNGPQHYASLGELAQSALGEDVPLEALPDWLRGRPWAGAPHQTQEGGMPSRFQQLEWTVDASRLDTDGVIEARRDRAPAVRLRVRLDR